MRSCLYAGSFDPLTFGHVYVIEECLKLFDTVYVAIGINSDKKDKYWFTPTERSDIIKSSVDSYNLNVIVYQDVYFIDKAIQNNVTHIVRGVRGFTDLDEELKIIDVNRTIAQEAWPDAPVPSTIFIPPPPHLSRVSSSMVKSLIGYRGWESQLKYYVPPAAEGALIQRYHDNR